MTVKQTLDPRLVSALRPAILESPDQAVDQELREAVLTMARELVAQGASADTVHGVIAGHAWQVMCELAQDAPLPTEAGKRCQLIRDQIFAWLEELWPGGIMPRSRRGKG